MAFNVAKSAQIPITVFGSLVTETSPTNLPEGVSPDCQDVVFRPGSVLSRPGCAKVFATPFGTARVNYAKSYVDNTGVIRNLYLDSTGNIWMEAIPSPPVLLSTTTFGSYAKSITAFGREYIAISDGLHGTDIPLQYDGTFLDRVTQDGPGAPPTIANLIIPPVAMSAAPNSLTRASNVVTAVAATPHGLQVGYRAQISGVTAQPVGFITSITIKNDDSPGIATVLMATPHGLSPGIQVAIQDPPPVAVGGGVNSATLIGDVLTLNTNSAHNLQAGAVVTVVLTGGTASTALAPPSGGFNATLTVSAVPSSTSLVCILSNSNTTNAAATGGSVSLNWPPDSANPEQNFWTVLQVPSTTTFQIAINYVDGVWAGSGTGVFEPWDGTFFVASVPTTTTFTYAHQGPNGTSADVGTITPTGQASPGNHQMQVLFLTRQGYVTQPSPPVKFVANGGQYLNVTNMPIGPPNVVARILAFTGAEGAFFFYIPVPAQVNGQVVSTATQINDNVTTSVTLDFSDNTLFASIGISQRGNDLANQIILEGALSFGFFGSRLITWGQRNRIQNLLNMGFDGGAMPSTPTLPSGWTAANGTIVPGRFGQAWQFGSTSSLIQSFYQDAYGAPIAKPNTKYLARAWVHGLGSIVIVTISSVLGGFSTSATLTGTSSAGSFVQNSFTSPMPMTIPTDMILTITGPNGAIIDEVSIIYADNPYLDTILYGSYVDNPEAFDGLSGKFGPSDDTHKVMGLGIIRATPYLLTQEPSGRIHAIANNGFTEPSGWTINEVAANCGLISAFALTQSQADDSAASGGEEWFAWASSSGARIFGGNQPWKISQEIQPDWDRLSSIALATLWALNDPVNRIIYFGLPLDLADSPSFIYPIDYRELNSAQEIYQAAPVHTSFSGKLVATDHTRKWTRWNLQMNGAALMYRGPGVLSAVFFAGGANPLNPSTGQVYTLDVNHLTDDDFGQIFPYYTTFFMPSSEQEQGLQLGSVRKQLQFMTWDCGGVGNLNLTVFVNKFSNQWPLSAVRALSLNQTFDSSWPGGNAIGERMAFKFASSPSSGTDNSFNLQKVVAAMRPAARTPVRGSST